MDTVHDLGGVEGFGPIPNLDEGDAEQFSAEWKGRIWAIAMLSRKRFQSDETGWTLDWYRHILERVPPDLYLRIDYFDKWILAMMACMVDEGVADIADFVEGNTDQTGFDYKTQTPLEHAPDVPGRFAVGDRVATCRDLSAKHTRLARYVRGRVGTIESVIGFQALPDAASSGLIRKEQTYVVGFQMSGLWPEASQDESNNDTLLIDLWDSYLAPA